MVLQRGDLAVQDDTAEILDVAVDRVAQKSRLHPGGKAVHGIENGRAVHQKQRKDVIQVIDVPEKDEQRRQHQPHTDVEQNQAGDGVQQHQKARREGNAVDGDEQEEHQQRQAEVDQRRDVFGQQEHILWHVDLGDDAAVVHQRAHAGGGGVLEIVVHQVSAEQVDGVVRLVMREKLAENQAHDQKLQKRRQNAPPHAQHSALVFDFEVTGD